MAYNEGFHSYTGQENHLRMQTAVDLLGEDSSACVGRDNISGAGSKIITETKIKKGSFKRHKGPIPKEDIISTRTDQDAKHYFDHVSHELMEEGHFVQAKYEAFRDNALRERETLGIQRSAEMNSLYCFWCFYLREHFNEEMYHQFLELAREDVAGGSHYGIECFFRFSSYGLEGFWNEEVYEDFQNEAMADNTRGSTYGLEKLKAFLVNQKYTFKIPTKPEVEAELAKYPTLQSFKEQRQQFQRRGGNGVHGPPRRTHPQNKQPQEKQAVTEFVIGEKKQINEPPKPPERNERSRGRRGRGGSRGGKAQPPAETRGGNTVNRGGWVFGKMQPASAPQGPSPIRRKW